MALTGLQVYLKPPRPRGTTLPFDGLIEYSRNERGREIVKLNVLTTPSDGTQAGEEITVYLTKARRERNEEVVQARATFTIPAGVMPTKGYEFEWDLRNVVFSADKPFPIIRRGNYFFEVEHTGGTTGPSAVEANSDDFRVALLTVDRLEAEWLFGATRRSNDDRAVRFQPRKLNGVRVIEVSKQHPLDLFPLKLSYGGETPDPTAFLSWGGGEIVNIDTSIPGGIDEQYTLADEDRTGYIIVQVDPCDLPATDTCENLLIDKQLIDRDSIRRWIDQEAQWLEENFLHTPIEPSLVVTDYSLKNFTPSAGQSPPTPLPENFDYDILTAPVTYYPPKAGHWINLQLPMGLPLHFDYLVGSLENTRIVDVSTEWIHKGTGRHISLMPFNQSLAYNFIGLMYVHAVRGPTPLPSFWRTRYMAGIHDKITPSPIVEALGLRAAVMGLTVLGMAFRGGFSSESVSRDGVSSSVSYTSSAMYGIYSSSIEEYKKRLEPLEKQLKRKYFGIMLEVL